LQNHFANAKWSWHYVKETKGAPATKPDEEELFGGLVKVGNAELGKSGIKIALGEIVRRARKLFAKRE
jgi:hypothetical protein